MKRQIAFFTACALSFSIILPGMTDTASAKVKKPKLKKSKISVEKNKKAKITIKGKKIKKTKWSIKSKKIATLSKKKKTSVVVKGKKAGKKTTVTAKVTVKGRKRPYSLKCKVTVVKAKPAPTPTPTVKPTVKPSVKPTDKAPDTGKPVTPSTEKPPVRDTSAYERADIISNTFDENWEPFVTRKNEDQKVSFSLTDDAKFAGKALKVSGRERMWNGAFLELTDIVVANATYHVEFWVKQELNAKRLPDIFYCTTETAAVPAAEATDDDKTWTYLIDAGTKVDREGTWVKVEGNFSVPASSKHFGLCFETKGYLNNFFLDEFHLDLVSAPAPKIDLTGLHELYKDKFIIGNAVGKTELQDAETVAYVKNMYGSITMGNEMKPDAIMSSTLIDKTSDTAKDYVIPAGYTDDKVPTLNFTDTDFALKTASENGLKLRVHTLLWHQQTPSWFFKEGYTDSGALVSKEVMDKRLEFYVKSVMKHILSSQYADVVYAVDVVNEYFHSNGAENAEKYKTYWQKIYGVTSTGSGDEMTNTEPPYVKAAFVYAYDVVKEYSKTDTVKLYYNDYNTYIGKCADNMIKMVNWINTTGDGNTDGKICAGVGMQSHLDTAYPTFDAYKTALEKFAAAGFDIQITELDITMGQTSTAAGKLTAEAKAKLLAQQTEYYEKLMNLYLEHKDSISAVVFWGLSSQGSWRAWGDPCIFGLKGMYDVKDSYKKMVELGGGTFPPAGSK